MSLSLHRLLESLLDAFDPGAVLPHYKPSVVGFLVPAPHKESWSLRLDDDGVALLPGLAEAEIVVQAPLDVFERGLTPGQPWDIWTGTNIVGYGSPGDSALLSRVLGAFHIAIDGRRVDVRQPRAAAYFAMPLRHPAGENVFGMRRAAPAPLPDYDPDRLPGLVADDHPGWVAAYDYAWETAFANLRQPAPESGFVSNFIDTAFNECTFLWDSCFMTMFGRYGTHVFPFIGTLDNFYVKQHPDGFICREINTDTGEDRFTPHDARSTGPNVFAWAEWLHYQFTGDRARLETVFPVLVAYHHWLRDWRTWPGGGLWTSGLGSGMDNQSRVPDSQWHHRHHTWVDATMQQALNCRLLGQIGAIVGQTAYNAGLEAEYRALEAFVNARLWNEATGFYHDVGPDGAPSPVKTVGAYWGLLAGIVPDDRARRLIAHLDDPATFRRPHRVPSQSADSPGYRNDGGYWLGGVWSPTNYMVLHGLLAHGAPELAHAIACEHVDRVARVFAETGTLWENYAPEFPGPSRPAKPNFVGWTGLSAIGIPIEFAIGLRRESDGALAWDIRLAERHGVVRYPLRSGQQADLLCERRAGPDEPPRLRVRTPERLTLRAQWAGGAGAWDLDPGEHTLAPGG